MGAKFIFIVAVLSLAPIHHQGTIYEQAVASGGKQVDMMVVSETNWKSLSDLVRESDLIVRGRLVKIKAYVSENGANTFTDYQLHPSRVLVDRRANQERERPGGPIAIIMALLGGELEIGGTHVTMSDTSWKRWNPDSELLLFLRASRSRPDRYFPDGGGAGMFEIGSGDQLRSLGGHGDAERGIEGTTIGELTATIMTGRIE